MSTLHLESFDHSVVLPHMGTLQAHQELFLTLAPLERIYPTFREWFFGKIVSSSVTNERASFIKRSPTGIIGVGIAKRTALERKLCTLWIRPDARNTGAASEIAEQAFDWLGTAHPVFTVPEERLSEFRGLLNRWHFRCEQSVSGYYRAGQIEHIFNGRLKPNFSS